VQWRVYLIGSNCMTASWRIPAKIARVDVQRQVELIHLISGQS
jgi:hypothetical protein